MEDIDHLFFHCHLAKFIWEVICEVFHLSSHPTSWEEFSVFWLGGKGPLPKNLIMFLFSAFAWALWITRNKIAIEKKFPKAPIDVIYSAMFLIQKWSVLLREKDQKQIMKAKGDILNWLKSFKMNPILHSDVVEL